MATAYVSFGSFGASGKNGLTGSIRDGNPTVTETITTSGTSAASTAAATVDGFVSVFCETAVYAHVAEAPTATAVNGWHCPGGFITEIGVTKGQKVALIDA